MHPVTCNGQGAKLAVLCDGLVYNLDDTVGRIEAHLRCLPLDGGFYLDSNKTLMYHER